MEDRQEQRRQDGEAHPFRLDVVEIGEDEDGEPITSCVVMPDENAGEAVRRVKLPSGRNQRLIWDGLKELFKAAGDRRPEGAPEELPKGRPVLSLDEAIDGTRDRLTCDVDQRKYRAQKGNHKHGQQWVPDFSGRLADGFPDHPHQPLSHLLKVVWENGEKGSPKNPKMGKWGKVGMLPHEHHALRPDRDGGCISNDRG
ncbi:MAG: hypothetical protein IPH41_18645 [Sulfuritalea sp.]|nr:hypothetical protein [Sulfuritalea sp.]